MLAKLRSHLTYANVMATIAVFVALGGGAYAAIKLPANSVGTKQIKKKAVTPAKVAPATTRLFKGQKGDPGSKGDTGATGQSGTNGQQGASGASLVSGLGSGTSNNSGGTTYFQPYGGSTASPIPHVSPQVFVARDLYVSFDNAPGVGAARGFTLVVDNSPTSLTCTITHPATTCENGAATAAVPKGSSYMLRMDNSATAPADAGFIRWAFRATTP